MAAKKKTPEPAPEKLECTFSEEEVKQVAAFINVVFKNARWTETNTSREIMELSQHFNIMHKHLSKIESCIFEHVRTTKTKKAD